jgi:hypothetical protein
MSSDAGSRRGPGWLSWTLLGLATLLLCYPLLGSPSLPRGSDIIFTSQSAHGFTDALGEGVFYPRWIDPGNRGFGSPAFVFYPPLAYYAIGLGSLLSGDLFLSIKLVLIVAALLSGLTFLVAAREVASERASLVGAVLYVLAPYHVLDLYYRFALAEYVAFVWFPLLWLFTRRLCVCPGWGSALGLAVSYAGLVLTHLVTAYMMLLFLPVYALLLLARSRRWMRLLPLAGAGLVGVLCASVYFVPAIAERDEIHVGWFQEAPYGDYRRNFVYRDEVSLGYLRAPIKPWVARATSAQLALSVAAVAVLGWRRRIRPPFQNDSDAEEGEGLAQAGLSLWTFLLQVSPTAVIWGTVPQLAIVQFPWRFGTLQALSACALVAMALDAKKRDELGGGRFWLTAGILLLAVLPTLWVSSRLQLSRPLSFDRETAAQPMMRSWVMYEYIPSGVGPWRDFGRIAPYSVEPVRLEMPGQVDVVGWSTHSRRISVETPTPNRLRLRTFAYPGWVARLDGEPAPIRSDNPYRAIEIEVPAGTHRVEFDFRSTPDRRVGALLSGVTLAALLAGLLLLARRRA